MRVVSGDGAFDAVAYGQTHPNVKRFIEEQSSQVLDVVSEGARNFMDYVDTLAKRVTQSEYGQAMQVLTSKKNDMWESDYIRELHDTVAMQQAQSQMRRWIMAETETRKLYHQQRLEGFEGLYEDNQPGKVGEDHIDYRLVMDGAVEYNEVQEGDTEITWSATTYFNNHYEEDDDEVPLSLYEQTCIRNTWARQKELLREHDADFTSPDDSPL